MSSAAYGKNHKYPVINEKLPLAQNCDFVQIKTKATMFAVCEKKTTGHRIKSSAAEGREHTFTKENPMKPNKADTFNLCLFGARRALKPTNQALCCWRRGTHSYNWVSQEASLTDTFSIMARGQHNCTNIKHSSFQVTHPDQSLTLSATNVNL